LAHRAWFYDKNDVKTAKSYLKLFMIYPPQYLRQKIVNPKS
jgi:hypothetical protein